MNNIYTLKKHEIDHHMIELWCNDGYQSMIMSVFPKDCLPNDITLIESLENGNEEEINFSMRDNSDTHYYITESDTKGVDTISKEEYEQRLEEETSNADPYFVTVIHEYPYPRGGTLTLIKTDLDEIPYPIIEALFKMQQSITFK